jgi:CPA2 family monovalent cation:H+ antiporter-2
MDQRLRQPAILGFLLAGLLGRGPHGLGLVTAVHTVEVAAELGVVLLMFTIGAGQSLDSGGGKWAGGWWMAAKGAGVMLLLLASAKWLVPWAMDQVTATRNREFFLVAVVLLCLAVAGLISWAGLSLAPLEPSWPA